MRRSVPAVLLAALCAGCGGSDVAPVGEPVVEEVGVVTVVSDDSRATVEPLCVGELPEDFTTCAGAPANLGEVELDQTRKATVNVPTEVAQGGYRLRVNGTPLPEHAGVLEEISQVVRMPVVAAAQPTETVLTVEALRTPSHPPAVWQVLLSGPTGAPE